MKNYTAILIDDEVSNLKGLERKIKSIAPSIEIVGLYQHAEDAITALQKEKPDIVFLDIEMPRINGFELLAQLTNVSFKIIFVTAYNEFAIKAFKNSAIDYVLKPIDNNDLAIAITKAQEAIKRENASQSNERLINLLSQTIEKSNKLVVPTSKGVSFLSQENILHLEGYDGYTRIHTTQKEIILSSYNLGKFTKQLLPNFFKCHKSHIINIDKVTHFENEGYLVLDNNHRVPISKSNRKVFLDLYKE